MEIHDDKDMFLASYGGQLTAAPYERHGTPLVRDDSGIILERDIHIWTDGSAKDNGLETCTAGAAWTSDLTFHDEVSLAGIPLSNNVAEVAAVVLCLQAWRSAHIVVHTDSTLVLDLVGGGLLAMERDGWRDTPRHFSMGTPTGLKKTLLHLLRDRSGRLAFQKAKAHADDVSNNLADHLANQGRLFGRVMCIDNVALPSLWVDSAPVLAHQPLDYITKMVVQQFVPSPTTTVKFSRFSDRWVVAMAGLFNEVLDPGHYIANVWKINIPLKFQETLWKEMNNMLTLGHRYHGRSDSGRFCRCRTEMSLNHILLGCRKYVLRGLQAVLLERLRRISPSLPSRSLHPDEWGHSPWFPLLALKRLEQGKFYPSKSLRSPNEALSLSRPVREWLIGNYFWQIWKWRMKEIHDTSFNFIPILLEKTLASVLDAAPPVPSAKERTCMRDWKKARDASSDGTAHEQCTAPLENRPVKTKAVPMESRKAGILRALTDGAYD